MSDSPPLFPRISVHQDLQDAPPQDISAPRPHLPSLCIPKPNPSIQSTTESPPTPSSSKINVPSFMQFIRKKIRFEESKAERKEMEKENRRKRMLEYCTELSEQQQRQVKPAMLKRQLSMHNIAWKPEKIDGKKNDKEDAETPRSSLGSARHALKEINADTVFERLNSERLGKLKPKSLDPTVADPLQCKESEEYQKLIKKTRKPARLKRASTALELWQEKMRRGGEEAKFDNFHDRSKACASDKENAPVSARLLQDTEASRAKNRWENVKDAVKQGQFSPRKPDGPTPAVFERLHRPSVVAVSIETPTNAPPNGAPVGFRRWKSVAVALDECGEDAEIEEKLCEHSEKTKQDDSYVNLVLKTRKRSNSETANGSQSARRGPSSILSSMR